VKVKPDGIVKVLDFGLAKMPEAAMATSAGDSATVAMAATVVG
jgi:hypothetical protein